MNTPIYHFVQQYNQNNSIRMHMPGHKGRGVLGCESLDITEISGADELFCADGIIAESEKNASLLFGCPTFYSTEGSSLCIRSMLYLAMTHAIHNHKKPLIISPRNVHKTFLTAIGLLDLDVEWLNPQEGDCYLSQKILLSQLRESVQKYHPTALYLTSPDYLGYTQDISILAEFCHQNDMLLLLDHAHGAYDKFLPNGTFPIDFGADICCDSAHKTLPVLTGGAYLHLSEQLFRQLPHQVKKALSLFASTSPSYLILQSLDLCNHYLETRMKDNLDLILPLIQECKEELLKTGFELYGNEPLKITIMPKSYGYTGKELAEILMQSNIFPEFYDHDFLVLMPSVETKGYEIQKLKDLLLSLPQKEKISDSIPLFLNPERKMRIRSTLFMETEILPIEKCIGKICAEFTLSCPPAVPIVMCGEMITKDTIQVMKYYNITKCNVIKQ